VWSASGPWRAVGTRFALLPLALGLLAAGLLSACTISTAPQGGKTSSLHATPLRALADPSALQPAAVPVVVRFAPDTMTHAEQGDVDAMYRLALMHETGGGGVAQDRSEMLRWLALASKLGHGPASYKLFMHYDDQPQGSARALRFKDLAQRQGYFGPSAASSRR
jgi:hypothetical protein